MTRINISNNLYSHEFLGESFDRSGHGYFEGNLHGLDRYRAIFGLALIRGLK